MILLQAGADGELSTESVFMHYMDAGLWYVFLFNDKDEAQRVSFVGTRTGMFSQTNIIMYIRLMPR